MGNILLIGGMGSGKTTLIHALRREVPDLHYICMLRYGMQIPLTLRQTVCEDILSLSKESYLRVALHAVDTTPHHFSRDEIFCFGSNVVEKYGSPFFGELALTLLKPTVPSLVDNLPGELGVRFPKDKGFYVVGLEYDLNSCLSQHSANGDFLSLDIKSDLERKICLNDAYFQVNECLALSHVRYNVNFEPSDSPRIVREVVGVLRR